MHPKLFIIIALISKLFNAILPYTLKLLCISQTKSPQTKTSERLTFNNEHTAKRDKYFVSLLDINRKN